MQIESRKKDRDWEQEMLGMGDWIRAHERFCIFALEKGFRMMLIEWHMWIQTLLIPFFTSVLFFFPAVTCITKICLSCRESQDYISVEAHRIRYLPCYGKSEERNNKSIKTYFHIEKSAQPHRVAATSKSNIHMKFLFADLGKQFFNLYKIMWVENSKD